MAISPRKVAVYPQPGTSGRCGIGIDFGTRGGPFAAQPTFVPLAE